MYDKWWAVLGVDVPDGDHPLWETQSTNTRSGGDTWRCKECHGWDYKGVEGTYGSGSHLTGFAGVMGVKGKPAAEILETLRGSTSPDHDFSAYMDEQALADLAVFLSEELLDANELVKADGTSTGDAARGEENYVAVCTSCHGPQGSAINFGDLEELEFVGHIAADNPWEFIHKVRFGAPGWPMPSSIINGWSNEDVADVMAYASGLSQESMASAGGLLYDKWWVVTGGTEPTGDSPLWKTQTSNTRTGPDTWRCKECHGWDYKGVDGAYGSGSHLTGIKGVLGASMMSAEDLTAALSGGKNPGHNFAELIGEAGINALVIFLQTEMVDTATIINADASVVGDPAAGKEVFENTCAACHGEDGKKLNFGSADEPEYIGTLALDNPWEFFHKVNYGQPGQPMPNGISMGWSIEEIADIIAFAQTLPAK